MPNINNRSTKVNLVLEQAIQAVLSDRPIAYHSSLAKALESVTAGVLLSQFLYWQPRSQDSEGWFWKTRAEIYDETALTRFEQEGARKRLCAKGVLEEKRRGVPARMHFRINIRKLIELLSQYHSQGSSSSQDSSTSDQLEETQPSSWRKTSQLDGGKPPTQNAGNQPTITETTAETTSKTRTETTPSSKGKSSDLGERTALLFSKKKVSKFEKQGGGEDTSFEDPDLTPNRAATTAGLTSVGALISLRRAQELAQVDHAQPTTQGSPPRKRTAPPASPWIEQLLTDFSSELHDEEHTRQNISQAARLWQESGREEAAFVQLLYEARSLTKQYRVKKKATGEAGEYGLRNKMPYYFSVLKDLLGLKEPRTDPAPGRPAAPRG